MADELDLEQEIDEALIDESPKDEDFDEPELQDEPEETVDEEPEKDPEPVTPQIADDRESAKAQAEEVARQWATHVQTKEQELEDIRKSLIEAEDTGESAEVKVAIQEKLATALLEVREAKKGFQEAATYHQQVSTPRAPAAQAWIDANPRYRTDPAFKARAIKIAAQLEADGYSVTHPRLYQELDKRLRAKPVLGKPGKSGAAPVNRGSQQAAKTSGPTDFDKRWMSKIGLNPNDKRHLAEWKHHYAEMAEERG